MNADVIAAETAAPRHAICYRTDGPLTIDGRAAEPIWAAAPWTDDFVDIEGAVGKRPRHRTRVRMLHDPSSLYIHAELDEPDVWAAITRRNAVVFHDNDFEVFIDPDGDNHEYYELEVNALNTVWELSLPRPYRCGATPRDPDPIEGLRTAVHVDGTLNDPADRDRGWSVTIAIPFEGLTRFVRDGRSCPPADGDVWRMNFSRVQWPHEVVEGTYRKPAGSKEENWVWSPQGVIDMHRPATWGYVQFSDLEAGRGHVTPRDDPTLAARSVLMGLWERQRLQPSPTDDLAALGLADQPGLTVECRGMNWRAWMAAPTPDGPAIVLVDQDARLTERRLDDTMPGRNRA